VDESRGQKKKRKNFARKIEEYRAGDGTLVKIYFKKSLDEAIPAGVGPLVCYFRCSIGDIWVTYVVTFTEGLRAILGAKGTTEDAAVAAALSIVTDEIAKGHLEDGAEVELGALHEEIFPSG
jgi:hypothetical protein